MLSHFIFINDFLQVIVLYEKLLDAIGHVFAFDLAMSDVEPAIVLHEGR
jgi:hypothetical protein